MSVDYCRCAVPVYNDGECELCGGFIYVATIDGQVRPVRVDGVPIDLPSAS